MKLLRVTEVKIRELTIALERNPTHAISTTGVERVFEHLPFAGINVECNLSSGKLRDVPTC